MKIYITKYALTKGIICKDLKQSFSGAVYYGGADNRAYSRREAFKSIEDAVSDCEKRRSKKLKQLNKQIERISAMTFEVKEE